MRWLRDSFLIPAWTVILAASVLPAWGMNFSKPSAVISFGGYNKMVADLNALGAASGQPGMGSGIDMMAKIMFQGIDAIDPDKPWGMAYASEGTESDAFLIFMPVSQFSKLEPLLKARKFKSEKISDDYYKLMLPASSNGTSGEENVLFIKQQGNWIFGASRETLLEELPSDPEALLKNIKSDYLFAIEVYAQNGGIQWLQRTASGMNFAAGPQAGSLLPAGKASQETEAVTQNGPVTLLGLDHFGPLGIPLRSASDQIDTLTLSMLFAKDGGKMKSIQLDAKLKALPDTDFEKQIESATALTSDFAGFHDAKAAISLNMSSSKTTPEIIPDLKKKVATFHKNATEGLIHRDLTEEELTTAKEWIDRLTKMLEATVEKGRLDTGFQINYAPNASTILLGIRVANSTECSQVAEQLGQLIAKEKNATANVTLDAKSIDGVKLYKVKPVPMGNSKVFGEDSEMIIGISEETVYVGLGKDPIKNLNSAIQKSKSMRTQAIPMFRVSVDTPQLTQMVNAQLSDQGAVVPESFSEMFKADVDNSISVQIIPEQNSLVYRLELPASVAGALLKSGMGQIMPGSGGGTPAGGMPIMMSMPR